MDNTHSWTALMYSTFLESKEARKVGRLLFGCLDGCCRDFSRDLIFLSKETHFDLLSDKFTHCESQKTNEEL